MAPPSVLTITLVSGNSPSSVTMNISSALQSLQSGQTASSQTGFDAAQVAIANIFKAKVFRDSAGIWHPTSQILTITAS